MNQKHRTLSGVGIAVVTTLALSGCAANHPATTSSPTSTATATNQSTTTNVTGTPSTNNNNAVSNNTTTGTSTGNTASVTTNVASNQTSSMNNNMTGSAGGAPSAFPAIIAMAMKTFPANVLTWAEASTTIPLSASGSNELFYKTAESTTPIMSHPGFLSSYSVTLSSPSHQIADFSGLRYDSSSHASQAMSYSLESAPLSGSQSSVFVGSKHHNATLAVDAHGATSVIGWSEGNWTIRVKNADNTSAPTLVANQVADYLDAHFMPVPHGKGLINVQTGTTGTVAVVTWQETNQLFETDANKYAKNPISTALGMSISMRNY